MLTIGLATIQTFVVGLIRVTGMLSAIPILGSRTVPLRIRVLFAIATALLLVPILDVTYDAALITLPLMLSAMVGEFFIGFILGLALRLVFSAIAMAGEIIGMSMGFGLANILDPISNSQTALIGQFYGVLASLVFLAIDGHHVVLAAIVSSFHMVPPFTFQQSPALGEMVMELTSMMFALALKIAAPIVVVILLTNTAVAILGRMVPSLNVILFAFPVSIGMGLFMIGISLPFVVKFLVQEFEGFGATIDGLLRVMGHG